MNTATSNCDLFTHFFPVMLLLMTITFSFWIKKLHKTQEMSHNFFFFPPLNTEWLVTSSGRRTIRYETRAPAGTTASCPWPPLLGEGCSSPPSSRSRWGQRERCSTSIPRGGRRRRNRSPRCRLGGRFKSNRRIIWDLWNSNTSFFLSARLRCRIVVSESSIFV